MLTFDQVNFSYPSDGFPLIRQLSFHISRGEFVSVIGTSGCGKSTIFRLINQLLKADSGQILVNGKNISGLKNYCGYMPQHDLLLPWRTVEENVRLPLEIRGGMSRMEMKERTAQVLNTVGLSGWGEKAPRELSGGMRQRAAFARTILTEADLLLLDEPFSALDYLTRLSLREWLLEQWEREKKTVLFITHDVEEAVFLSNRILVVEEKPVTHLKSIEVPAEYPRSREQMAKPELTELKEQLIRMLGGM